MPQGLTIIYEHGEDGWRVATIPEVPGAFSQGRTKAEARENVLDALLEIITGRRVLASKEPVRTIRSHQRGGSNARSDSGMSMSASG